MPALWGSHGMTDADAPNHTGARKGERAIEARELPDLAKIVCKSHKKGAHNMATSETVEIGLRSDQVQSSLL